ncbi:hypothetical protein BGW41_001278 [Actinomortierella wolfii]|nr:hypothetical protein BGW41_001278 [Actinomortierella wolfii]
MHLSFPMVFSQHHVEFLDMLKRLKSPLRGTGTSVLQEEQMSSELKPSKDPVATDRNAICEGTKILDCRQDYGELGKPLF